MEIRLKDVLKLYLCISITRICSAFCFWRAFGFFSEQNMETVAVWRRSGNAESRRQKSRRGWRESEGRERRKDSPREPRSLPPRRRRSQRSWSGSRWADSWIHLVWVAKWRRGPPESWWRSILEDSDNLVHLFFSLRRLWTVKNEELKKRSFDSYAVNFNCQGLKKSFDEKCQDCHDVTSIWKKKKKKLFSSVLPLRKIFSLEKRKKFIMRLFER